MKILKRSLALALTMCMLIGMPLFTGVNAAVTLPSSVDLVRADVTGSKTLDVFFSTSVRFSTNNNDIWTSIRLVDNPTGQNLQMEGATHLQWGGVLKFYTTASGTLSTDPDASLAGSRHQLRWEMTGAITIDGNNVDTIEEILALTAPGGKYENYTAMFSIEEKNIASGDARRNNGKVDTIWMKGDGARLLNSTKPGATNSLDGAYVELSACDFTLDNAYCYNDNAFIMEFSEKVGNFGGYYIAVRLVDENNNLRYNNPTGNAAGGGDPYQWQVTGIAYYGAWGNASYGNRLTGTLSGTTLTAIAAIAQEKGYSVKLCIEEGAHGSANTSGDLNHTVVGRNGFVDNFYALDDSAVSIFVDTVAAPAYQTYTRRLAANSPSGRDGVYIDITPVTEKVTIESLTAVGATEFYVKFSEPVAFNKYILAPSFYVRLVDGNNNVMADSGTNLSWDCTLAATEDPTLYKATMTGRAFGYNNLADILALTADDGRFPNYTMVFGIGQNIQSGDILGHTDNVTSLDGVRLLDSNRPSWDGLYLPIGGIGAETPTLVSATALNDAQVLVTFSMPVDFTPIDPWMSLRLVDGDDKLVWDSGIQNQGTPMQWSGSWAWADAEQTQLLWTMYANNSTYNVANVSDLLAYKGMASFTDFTVKFGIEESPGNGLALSYDNGGVDNVLSAGFKPLAATCNAAGYRNAAYAPLTAGFDITPVTVTGAEQYSETEILITFSEPVEITGAPFTGIRMVGADGRLVWDGGAWNAGTPMQWGGSWSYYGPDQTQILWRIGPRNTYDINNLTDLLTYTGLEDFTEYRLQFCIEETRPRDGVDENFRFAKNDGLISNITRKDSPKLLSATLVVFDFFDGSYTDITLLDYDPSPITLTGAAVVNDSQILLTFSEAIKITGSIFAGVRLVHPDGGLVWDGGAENTGTPMQWSGRWEYANTEQTQVLWTMGYNNTYGVESLADVLNYTGNLADFKAYDLQFCIEEGPIEGGNYFRGNGLIENIAGKSREKLADATLTRGDDYRDGIYADIAGTLPTDKVTIVGAEVVSDTALVVTFSAPVRIIGHEEDDKWRPFMAVRLVDETGSLVWDGEKNKSTPMQWSGAWEWADSAHTKIKWTMNGAGTYGVSNMADLLNYKNLEDFKQYALRFCIEELGDNIVNGNGLIDNICLAADPRIHLAASRPSWADGVYIDLNIGYTPKSVTASAKILNDTQVLVTFSQPVSVSTANPWMCLRYLDKNGDLVWSGEVNKGTPIQWGGSWAYVKDSRTQIIFTMYGGNTLGANNVYDVLYYQGACAQFEGATVAMCIEELGDIVIAKNGLIENITDLAGQNHLRGTYGVHYDGRYMILDAAGLPAEKLTVDSVVAVDDMTLEITFSGPVQISEGDDAPSIAMRYLSAAGATEAVVDGRLAIFQGNWVWKDDSQTVMVWTLDTARARDAKNLTEIFNFEGAFSYNSASTVALCIYEPENEDLPGRWNGRIDGVTSADGLRKLAATVNSDFGRSQTEIDVAYDLPDPAVPIVTPDPEIPVEAANYLWVYILAGALFAGILVFGLIGLKRRKKDA